MSLIAQHRTKLWLLNIFLNITDCAKGPTPSVLTNQQVADEILSVISNQYGDRFKQLMEESLIESKEAVRLLEVIRDVEDLWLV